MSRDHHRDGDPARVPDWLLERVALGEVPARRAGLDAQLRADPEAAERLAAIAADNQAILAAHPAAEVVAEVARRRRARSTVVARRSYRLAGVAVTAAAVVALLLLVRPGTETAPGTGADHFRQDDPTGSERVKGGEPYLRVHRQRGAGSERLVRDQRVTAGDRLQLSYVPADARYGVILSIDGRGAVTVHFPDPETGDTALAARAVVFLDHSYRLDDAPRFERFFLVTADHPISVPSVRTAAERLASQPEQGERGTLALDPDLEQSSFLLRKASR